jgi:hypothetical protein
LKFKTPFQQKKSCLFNFGKPITLVVFQFIHGILLGKSGKLIIGPLKKIHSKRLRENQLPELAKTQ